MILYSFQNLKRRSPDVIRITTNSKFEFKESEKIIDMCQAIQDMLKETKLKKAKEVAKNFHEMWLNVEKIA